MNSIRQTRELNKRELENAVPPSASWHADYRDTAYIYVGGLPFDISEGDIVTIFSQFGTPTHVNLIRDKDTGKSKGFCFLKYEDQRSCDLAVDNLGGADMLGRLLRVDHTRYKKREGEDEEGYRVDKVEDDEKWSDVGNGKRGGEDEEDGRERRKRHKHGDDKKRRERAMLKEEAELEELLQIKENGEEEDPMREYLIREKREEVQRALSARRERKHRHHHRDRNNDHDERDKDESKWAARKQHDSSENHHHHSKSAAPTSQRHRNQDEESREVDDRRRSSKQHRNHQHHHS